VSKRTDVSAMDPPAEPHRLGVTGVVVAALLVMAGFELWAILTLNHGVFLYALDDAYIHLGLAAHLHAGHYGINAGEPSSPSSSILWPFLLAPFSGSPQFEWVPLILNLLAALGTAVTIPRLLALVLGPAASGPGALFQAVLGVLLLVLFNTVGLIFVGLEHSLQVLLTLLAVLLLFEVAGGGRPRGWLWPVLVLGPLVRYENLVLTLPALGFLWFMGHRRAALVTMASLAGLLATFSLFLIGQGLPPLPSSVLMKMGSGAGPVGSLDRLVQNLLHTWSGPWLVLLGLALFARVLVRGERGPRGFTIVILLAILGHSLLGRFGAFHRYEIYVLAAAVTGAALVHRERIRGWFRAGPRLAGAIAFAVLTLASGRSLYGLVVTPFATHELYRQQYLMGRYAREILRAPVVVNDLGLVAFRNPCFVADLCGLGSPEVFEAQKKFPGMAWADTLCRRHGVGVAMIYDSWFPPRTASWKRIGRLRLAATPDVPAAGALAVLVRLAHQRRGSTVVVGDESVSFYAVRPEHEGQVRESLERLRPLLVKGAELVLE
jgi:hypothetical protein